MDYVGSRWYKCDFHLHTTASQCFVDSTVTTEQWVERVKEQGLDCIAITDHNTGEKIDEIKEAAKDRGLVVFPGVEITCDTSKIHLLVLFDINKTTDDINDFLIQCNITRTSFADKNAHTSMSIFEVAKLAHSKGALIIPAHIDDFNGLDSASNDNLKDFFKLAYIDAVQVVHEEFLDNEPLNLAAIKETLNNQYNNPVPPIDDNQVRAWLKPVELAIKNKLAILTFSDNPDASYSTKHGLSGIGQVYTWIKMDEKPTLESVRQAFLMPESRIKNIIESDTYPYKIPDMWLKAITITNSAITGSDPLKIEFSPQLNTIIGGRGSGKSSILRFLRGVFNRNKDILGLEDIFKDQKDFYRKTDKNKKGVLNEHSCIEVQVVRNEALYKITASNIQNSESQVIEIGKYNNVENKWEDISDEGFIEFIEFEHYSQKQIYEIAQVPNSLRTRIDNSIAGMSKLKNQREIFKRDFLDKSTRIRTIQQKVATKGRVLTEIKDIIRNIELLQQSGISSLLTSNEQFTKQRNIIKEFRNNIAERENSLQQLIDSFELADMDMSLFGEDYSAELAQISQETVNGIGLVKSNLTSLKEQTTSLGSNFEQSIMNTNWRKDRQTNIEAFNIKKAELEANGINDLNNYEKYIEQKEAKDQEYGNILEQESALVVEISERKELQDRYLEISKEITRDRYEFVNRRLNDEKVKITIKPFRDQSDFNQKLRLIIQRETGFEKDIEVLSGFCFTGNVEEKIQRFRDIILSLKKKESVKGISISGYFENLISGLSDAQIDEIELLLPEDDIQIQYKPSASSAFKSLSTASAGQKTTAILTFILSNGIVPLILDQPEDDLDNRLVYELVVDRLKQAKQNRQIIVVTHNANIPVNGDAEYVISMNSESKKLKVLQQGTVEQPQIKKEICDVMEGTEYAFKMRSKRYENIG